MSFLRKSFLIFIIVILATPAFAARAKGSFCITSFGGLIRLIAYPKDNTMISPLMGASLSYKFSEHFGLEGEFAYSKNKPADTDNRFKALSSTPFETTLIPLSLNLRYDFRPVSRLCPYFVLGAGGLHWQLKEDGKEVKFNSPKDAINEKIGMIHQHYKLVDVQTARFLRPGGTGRIDHHHRKIARGRDHLSRRAMAPPRENELLAETRRARKHRTPRPSRQRRSPRHPTIARRTAAGRRRSTGAPGDPVH